MRTINLVKFERERILFIVITCKCKLVKTKEISTKKLLCNGDVYSDNRMHARENRVTAAVTFSSLTQSKDTPIFWVLVQNSICSNLLHWHMTRHRHTLVGGAGETRGAIAEPKIKQLGSWLWLYHELLIPLFWQKDKSNSHLALRELHLSHKTRKETIKKDALTVGSIHMQYNVSSPQTRFNIFLHYFLQRFTANVFPFGELFYTQWLLDE